MSGQPAEKPIASVGEAQQAIANLNIIVDRLVEILTEEIARVRAGDLRDTATLAADKAELGRRYVIESDRVMAARELIARLIPDAIETLRKRHTAFQALLQTNLTVLATAHAVSEGIIRGVSGELARKRTPSTYGATGRANAPGAKAGQPLAVSRSL